MQNMQKYFGFKVTVSEFLEPQDFRVIQDRIASLVARGTVDLSKYKIYLHQLALQANSSHFGISGGLQGRLSSISLRFMVNPKQRRSGDIQFVNHLFANDIREEFVDLQLQHEIAYSIPVEHFAQRSVFQNILIALVRIGMREDHRKIKVTVSVTPKAGMLEALNDPVSATAQTILPVDFQKAVAFNRQTRLFDDNHDARTGSHRVEWVERMQFKVALSYPGNHRGYVGMVAKQLKSQLPKGALFYDKDFVAQLARPNLDEILQEVYGKRSDLIVVFVCADYQKSKWCGLEWRAIRDIINSRNSQAVMFTRFDDATIPGMVSGDGWVDLRLYKPAQVSEMINERVRLNESAAPSP